MMRFLVFLPFLFTTASAACKLVTIGVDMAARRAVWCDPHKTPFAADDDADGSKKMAAVSQEATTFWTTPPNVGYKRDVIGNVQIVFSFGAMDKAADKASGTRLGFARVMSLIESLLTKTNIGTRGGIMSTGKAADASGALNSRFYVDAKALATLPGAFWKPIKAGSPSESSPGPFPLNLYWREYYKESMEKAQHMVFLLTSGWFDSEFCGEELKWAAGSGTENRKTKSNIFIFLDTDAKTKFESTTAVPGSGVTKALWDSVKGASTNVYDLSGDPSDATLLSTIISAFALETTGFLESSAHFKKNLRRHK